MKLTYETDEAVSVSVEFDRWSPFDGERAVWRWTIAIAGEQIATADDLESSPLDHANPIRALGAFASFLLAWCEARGPESENWALVPPELRDSAIDWEQLAQELELFTITEGAY